MIKILKRMRRREAVMALICAVLVLGQIYFDLTLPDYMTSLTKLINTPGAQTAEILGIGLKMLGCTAASAGAVRCLRLSCGKDGLRLQLRRARRTF